MRHIHPAVGTLTKESEMVIPNIFSLSLTDPGSEVQAPVIVIGPQDTTVVAGIQATLECVANARYLRLFIDVLFIRSFIYSFIDTRTHSYPVTQEVKFSFHISREAKIKTFLHCLLPNTHTPTHT